MTTNDNDFLALLSNKFYCEKCDYITERKYNLQTHIRSAKHKNNANNNEIQVKISKPHTCTICCKIFNDRAGLWRHKNKCNCKTEMETVEYKNNADKKDELIEYLIKENKEIKDLILELAKKDSYNNCYNTNVSNKAFNLNLFLNETCKNAMNITDFVDSIKLQLSDLIDIGEIGYIEGISNIIVKNLNNLDETERPIHCTDKKRETFYVKDEDQWEKDDEEKKKLQKLVKYIANKNIKLLPQFRAKYPDYNNSSLKISDTYDNIVIEAMVSDKDKDAKIIKNISNVTTIKKSQM